MSDELTQIAIAEWNKRVESFGNPIHSTAKRPFKAPLKLIEPPKTVTYERRPADHERHYEHCEGLCCRHLPSNTAEQDDED